MSQKTEDVFNITGQKLLDATFIDEVAFACDGEPVLLSKTYRFDSGTVEVVRSTGNAVVSVAPADRMHTIQAGNTSATLITNLPVPDMRKDTPLEEWPASQQVPANGTVTNIVVGKQKTSENAGCDWRGRHVHLQFDESSPTGGRMPGSWARQISDSPTKPYVDDPKYTDPVEKKCKNDYCGDFKNNDPSNWAARTSW